MSTKEKRILATLGAVGTGLVAVAASLQGVNIASELSTEVQLVTLGCTGLGGALLGGVAYYRGALSP